MLGKSRVIPARKLRSCGGQTEGAASTAGAVTAIESLEVSQVTGCTADWNRAHRILSNHSNCDSSRYLFALKFETHELTRSNCICRSIKLFTFGGDTRCCRGGPFDRICVPLCGSMLCQRIKSSDFWWEACWSCRAHCLQELPKSMLRNGFSSSRHWMPGQDSKGKGRKGVLKNSIQMHTGIFTQLWRKTQKD